MLTAEQAGGLPRILSSYVRVSGFNFLKKARLFCHICEALPERAL